jgi:methyl acetate hydrolase
VGIAEINQLLQSAVESGEIPGVVAIVANRDRILYHQSFGKMDLENDLDMRKESIFSIASMTKPVTSVAVMMLYEEGKLDLDDPISQYMPRMKYLEVITSFNEDDGTYTIQDTERQVTIRHLLTHTSGFGYSFSNRVLSGLEEKTGLAQPELPLLHQPGEGWTYGMGTRVLGDLVEQISGQTLPRFYRERIFEPLGMQETYYTLPEEKYPLRVTRHQRENGVLIERSNPPEQQPTIFGDRGLLSTAQDYVKFLQMLLNRGTFNGKRLLAEDSVAMMTRNQIGEVVVQTQTGPNPALSRPFPMGAGRDKFGLGFQKTVASQEERHLRSRGSYSWSGLANTHFWADPEKEIAAVILMQVWPFYDEECIRGYRGFEELIYQYLD